MMDLEKWMEGYRRIWIEKKYDRDYIASLFSDDCVFRPEVIEGIEPAYVGLDQIHAYFEKWCEVIDMSKGLMVFGERFESGQAAAYEWWGTGEAENQEATEAGCAVLFFDSEGRCRDFRDYHQVLEQREEPFDGFGRKAT